MPNGTGAIICNSFPRPAVKPDGERYCPDNKNIALNGFLLSGFFDAFSDMVSIFVMFPGSFIRYAGIWLSPKAALPASGEAAG